MHIQDSKSMVHELETGLSTQFLSQLQQNLLNGHQGYEYLQDFQSKFSQYNLLLAIIIIINFSQDCMFNQNVQAQQNSLLETMTLALKLYKLILQKIQSEHRLINSDTNANSANKQFSLDELITNLTKVGSLLQSSNCKKILSVRLINRLVQVTILYRNKCIQSEASANLRGDLTEILCVLKQHQMTSHCTQIINTQSFNVDIIGMFQKIIDIVKKIVRQIRELIELHKPRKQSNLMNQKPLLQSISFQNTINPGKQRDNRERERKNSAPQTPLVKTLESKYKLTKEIISHVSLLAGMDVDLTHLRGLLYQAHNNFQDTTQERMDGNNQTLKCRNRYIEQYNQWKNKMRRKSLKKQKIGVASLNSGADDFRDCEKKNSTTAKNSMNNTSSKIPKLIQSAQLNMQIQNNEDRRRQQFKNMQALTMNRQFIHLSQIKNQKLARRPYAEVKQVLVAGDQLNYYSNKNRQGNEGSTSKAIFFMQRAAKNEKVFLRRKSFVENYRLITQ